MASNMWQSRHTIGSEMTPDKLESNHRMIAEMTSNIPELINLSTAAMTFTASASREVDSSEFTAKKSENCLDSHSFCHFGDNSASNLDSNSGSNRDSNSGYTFDSNFASNLDSNSASNFDSNSASNHDSNTPISKKRLQSHGSASRNTFVKFPTVFSESNPFISSTYALARQSTYAPARPKCRAYTTSTYDFESLYCPRPWRKKGHKKLYRLTYVFLAYTAVVFLINCVRVVSNRTDVQRDTGLLDVHSGFVEGDQLILERHRRYAVTSDNVNNSKDARNRSCLPRSVDNFPPNFISLQDTKRGGVIVHITIALYMFAALAIVCDDYFVPSLEHICEDLGLQADVAGATFMAAGSSAPEFMTSVIGVFFAKSDVGVGTIVGSAVFNILFIIGVCGIFAGMIVELTWYPLVRDTVFYLFSVLTLFVIIRDKSVDWYEAVVMIALYLLYIVIMYFNRPLETSSRAWVGRMLAKFERQPLVAKPPEEHVIPDDMKRARAHSRISQSSLSMSLSREYEKPQHNVDQPLPEEQETQIHENNTEITTTEANSTKNGNLMTVSEYESVWNMPKNCLLRCLWVILCPAKALFYVSIPDSRRPGIWSRLYLLSFIMSVLWISGLTYIMVWMVTITGDALDIPDTVMGLTLLAAGTSVPDCLSSIFVARDGYGDMAVSNSLGSNVFDILLCLGLPWLIECASSYGGSVTIDSGGLTYSALTLLATVAFLVASMGINKWKLTPGYGVLCLLVYIIVVTLSCLFELNVFEDINPPSCPR